MATAGLFREQGMTTIGISRNMENTDITRSCDVRDEDSVVQTFSAVVEEHGRIDVLVNCAGIVSTTAPLEQSVDEWESILRTNLIGTYLCCKSAILHMRPCRYGKIINVASIAGRSYSQTASLAYTCSKYGVIGLTRQLAATYGRDGITVNCVAPSQIMSETLTENVPKDWIAALAASNPVGRLAEVGEVAQTICFLAGDGAAYINGAVIDINGGQL
jgi:3-oxoacyl-[acyl-carrier protein] reductase